MHGRTEPYPYYGEPIDENLWILLKVRAVCKDWKNIIDRKLWSAVPARFYQQAAEENRIDIIKNLLEFGEDSNPRNEQDIQLRRSLKLYEKGSTLLHSAARYGRVEIFNLIVQNTEELYPIDQKGATPIHLAAFKGQIEICRIVMGNTDFSVKNPSDCKGKTPLHLAAKFGHTEISKMLVENINDVNPADKKGITPLHLAAATAREEICKYIMERIDNKNPADEIGTTPLHLAAFKGYTRICRLFLQNIHPDDKHPRTFQWPFHTPLELAHEVMDKGGRFSWRKDNGQRMDKDDVTALFEGLNTHKCQSRK